MTELSSTDDLIIDLHDAQGRVAVGVLLDKVQNKGNFANLEILGVSKKSNKTEALQEIMSIAKRLVPAYRDGLELGLHSSFPRATDFANENGLALYYETFEMKNSSPRQHAMDANGICDLATPEDERELFQVLVDSFSENVDTSIPSFEDWQKARKRPSNSKTWVARKDSRIVGFLSLVIPQDLSRAEIRTIGVLPTKRGNGLAKSLIGHALNHVATLNIPDCELTVAVQNKRALDLYRRLGFTECDHYLVYCWSRAKD